MRIEYGCNNVGYAACYVDYPGSPAPPPTELEFGEIMGGGKLFTGGLVTAKLKNIGDVSTSDVNWSIYVKGGIFGWINVTSKGTIDSLDVDSVETIQTTDKIFGLGSIDINITASAPNAPTITKLMKATVLGFFITKPTNTSVTLEEYPPILFNFLMF